MNIIYYNAHPKGFVWEWHQSHTVSELINAGHRVDYINPVEILDRVGTCAEYSQILLDLVKKQHIEVGCDFFFATATFDTLLPEAVDEIKKLGIPTVNLSCDELSHPFRIKELAPHFDLTWIPNPESAQLLQSWGADWIFMPWAANPNVYKPVTVEETRTVGFIGTCYGARARNLAILAEAGIPVDVYGKEPEKLYSGKKINNPLERTLRNFPESVHRTWHSLATPSSRLCVLGVLKRSVIEMFVEPVEKTIQENSDAINYLPSPPFEALGECFSRMAISLGSIELASTYVLKNPIYFIRLREFEVPMCGGIHLVYRHPKLIEYFEEDKEMLFYEGKDEMLDKAKFYLAPEQDKLRQSIRINARKRALAEHTWMHRYRKLGEKLALNF
jgi:spore maturation protein CgeB